MSETPDELTESGFPPESGGVDAFRHELLTNLPSLIDKAMQGYQRFATVCPPEDTKGFVAYQAGCRAALAHIHLLVKLAQWARAAVDNSASPLDAEHLDRLVREAEAALQDEPDDD